MPPLIEQIAGHRVEEHQGAPRVILDEAGWRFMCGALAAGQCTLLGLWGDTGTVHMAVLDQSEDAVLVVSLPCPDGRFPSVGASHPPAIRLERAIRSLFGLEPVGLPDARPWLDLGFWDVTHPLAVAPATTASSAAYAFLPTQGEGLHQIPVGPVHAGIIEPGHFRFTANGETVVRLEERLGYVHKGIEALMAGATLDKAFRLAG
ncbi:MAG TPA: hydrogenase expression protein HypE, partial [Pseudomonadota bacterium]|nr:hydrogenase expression protein HypE [Pseudomonadota bacterium]